MDLLFTSFLVLHIAGGSLGLLTGSINLLRRKGDKKHKIIGKVFTYSMLTAGLSSLVLSILHPNYFLFMVGVFTLYMIGTGNRYIYVKLLGSRQEPAVLDWIITMVMLTAGLLFIGLGIWLMLVLNFFGIVFIVFGGLGLLFVRGDFYNYTGKSRIKNFWLLAHLQRMTGAYIASLTAFIVVNAKYLPDNFPAITGWLLPTIIITPFIISWSRKYALKKAG